MVYGHGKHACAETEMRDGGLRKPCVASVVSDGESFAWLITQT